MDRDRKEDAAHQGTVVEALPNAMFRVEMVDGSIVLAYLAGKMKINRIKVLIGDTVTLVVDEYGKRGRITRRV